MDERKRIAIYGGTFDPVHRGHLEVARKTIELFGISQLLFVPARQAPHKLEQPVTQPLHRFAMLALATADDPNLLVSTFELDSPTSCYTVDTMDHFRSKFGNDADLFFVMGADSWREIKTWREWRRLIKTANHIVVTRPGYLIEEGADELSAEIGDVRGETGSVIEELLRERKPRVYFTDAAMIDVSATSIRNAALMGRVETLKDLVPAEVASYIIKYGLYKKSNEN